MNPSQLEHERPERRGTVVRLVRRAPGPAAAPAASMSAEPGADDWYDFGCRLEAASGFEAMNAYRRALTLDADHADARLNLGRLLHESGDVEAAEAQYRRALAVRPDDPTAAFNLGVALQDLGRPRLAIEAYRRASVLDSAMADAYFNLAGLCFDLGRWSAALRHLQRYRSLTRRAAA